MGRQDRAAQLQIGVGAGGVEIVVLEKCRRRQHDVGHRRGLGHELLVDADEQVVAGKALTHETEFRGDHHRIGILDEECGNRRAVAEVAAVAGQHRADARLVEDAGRRVEHVEPFEQGAVERHQPVVRLQRAAALVLPGAGHGRQAGHREELCRAVARARKAVADADIAPLRAAVEPREIDDRLFREAGDRRRPGRVAGFEMGFEARGVVGVARHVAPVRIAFLEQHVHDGAGESPVGAGKGCEMHIGGLGAGGAVGIDRRRASRRARAERS